MTQETTTMAPTKISEGIRAGTPILSESSREIASRLVETCLRIGPEDSVQIDTVPHMMPLSTEIGLACSRRGADNQASLHTDDGFFGLIDSQSAEQLSRPSRLHLALSQAMTVHVSLVSFENPERLRTVPPEKMAALNRSRIPIEDLRLKRKVRAAYVGLADITERRAETYGLNLAKWRKAVEAASTEDYSKLSRFGQRVSELLQGGEDVRIHSPEGTELTLKLAGRSPQLNDGIIDEKDMSTGSRSIVIPAGDVAVAVAEDSAQGRFVSNVPVPWLGRMVEGVEWHFKNGKISEFNAKNNLSSVKSQYEASKGDKDRIGILYLGLNSRAIIGQLFNLNHIGSGAISVGIGNNRNLGGQNESEFDFLATLSNGTLTIDGQTIIKNGKYTLTGGAS